MSTKIVVACPKCKASYSLPPEKEGLRVKCKCGRQFVAEQRGRSGGKKDDSSGLMLGLGIGGVAVLTILILILSSGGKKNQDEDDEPTKTSVVRRDHAPETQKAGPGGMDPAKIIPVGKRFVELFQTLQATPTKETRAALDAEFTELVATDYWYRMDRRWLNEAGEKWKPWEELTKEEIADFETELDERILHPAGDPPNWRFDEFVFDKFEPVVTRDWENEYPNGELHGNVHFRLRRADHVPGSGAKKPVLHTYVHCVFHPGKTRWMVEWIKTRLRRNGKVVMDPIPHEEDPRIWARRAAGRGRQVDVSKNFEEGLSEKGERIQTEEGVFGFAAKPRPIPHFEDTSADERRRLDELITVIADEGAGIEATRAVSVVLEFKRKAMPALLTSLHERYKEAMKDIRAQDRLSPAPHAVEMIMLTLRRMREEIYQDDPEGGHAGLTEFSKRVIEGGDFAAGAKRLRDATAFWFGWWAQNQNVDPKGEARKIGRRRPGGRIKR